jgi:tubulin polyglutamylase TTLL6/13
MLNEKFEPILLEVNHTPSFTTDTPLDQHIKYKLIKDTLILMNINIETKKILLQKAKECIS